MEYNFLPLWYKIRQKNRKLSFLRIMLFLIIILNLMIMFNIITNVNLINMEKTENKILIKNVDSSNKLLQSSSDIICLKTFEKINKIINNKAVYNKINVMGNKVDLVLKINNSWEYENIVKYIETNPSVKILKLGTACKAGDYYSFTISLEVFS